MILSNKSETAVFAGITPTDYGIMAEFGLITPAAPAILTLYQMPINPDSKPIGQFTTGSQVAASSVFLNIPLQNYKEATNDGTQST